MAKSLQGCLNDSATYFADSSTYATVDNWVFSFLGNSLFTPREFAAGSVTTDFGTVNAGRNIDAEQHIVSFAGTLTDLRVHVTACNRISVGRVVIYKNDTATTFRCFIGKKETGVIEGEGELTFVAGDKIHGAIFLPEQDETDEDFEGYQCEIIGVWCAMETDDGHFGVQSTMVHIASYPGETQAGNYMMDIGHVEQRGHSAELTTWVTEYKFQDSYAYTARSIGGNYGFCPNDDINGQRRSDFPYTTVVGPDYLRELAQSRVRVAGSYSNLQFYMSTGFQYGLSGIPGIADSQDPGAPFIGRYFIEANGTGTDVEVEITTDPDDPSIEAQRDVSGATATVAAEDLVCIGLDTFPALSADLAYHPYQNGITLTSAYHSITRMAFDMESDDTKLDVFLSVWTNNGVDDDMAILTEEMTAGQQLFPIFGNIYTNDGNAVADEEYIALSPPFCCAFTNLRVNCIQYDGDPVTFSFYVNGAETATTITVNGTGWFEDEVNITYAGPYDDITIIRTVAVGQTFRGILSGFAYTHYEVDDSFCPTEPPACTEECPDGFSFPELKERTLRALGEDPDNPVYWTDDEIGNYVNDAYIDLCQSSKALEGIEAAELTASSGAVALSRRVAQVLRVTFEDRRVLPQTKYELDRTEPHWEAHTGYVSHYVQSQQDYRSLRIYQAWNGTAAYSTDPFVDGQYTYTAWANGDSYETGDRVTRKATTGVLSGYVLGYVALADHIAVTADNAPGSGTDWETYWEPLGLAVWHVKTPAELSGECDQPELPQWCHQGIVFGAAARALAKYGEHKERSGAYETMAKEYESLLKGYVANRTPEKAHSLVRAAGSSERQPPVWGKPVEDA